MPLATELSAPAPARRRRLSPAWMIGLFAAVLLMLMLLVGLTVLGGRTVTARSPYGWYGSVLTHPGLTLQDRAEHLLTPRASRKKPGSKNACAACHGM